MDHSQKNLLLGQKRQLLETKGKHLHEDTLLVSQLIGFNKRTDQTQLHSHDVGLVSVAMTIDHNTNTDDRFVPNF